MLVRLSWPFLAFMLVPGLFAWWSGRRLVPQRDDPALAERLLARAEHTQRGLIVSCLRLPRPALARRSILLVRRARARHRALDRRLPFAPRAAGRAMGTGRLPRLAAALQHRVLRLLVRAASGAHADPLRRNVALARRCRRAAAARLVGHAVYANVPVARGRASPAVAPRVAADHRALAGRAPG